MSTARSHAEGHVVSRIGWLRAAVLGANDGIISTGSLMVGVAAATPATADVLVAGLAGIIAGAMSMAAGEYVSVSAQADTEAADLARERAELDGNSAFEVAELAAIYQQRGLSPALARQVAEELMAHDALGAHARDELGITDTAAARPLQAALASAATFSVGAAAPLLTALVAPAALLAPAIGLVSLLVLAVTGVLSARAGGTGVVRPTARIVFWGAAAMALTGLAGHLVGTAV